MRAWLSVVCCSVLLSACAGRVVVAPVQYGGTVSESSNKSVSVRLNAGITQVRSTKDAASAESGAFVPISSGPHPVMQFNAQDQRRFTDNLKAELVRLKIFRTASTARNSGRQADVHIDLLFTQTHHDLRQQQYVLDVVMLIASKRNKMAAKYRVVSEQEDARWTMRRRAASRGKQDAAQRLMDFLIPDIQEFLRRAHAPRKVPIVGSVAVH